MSRNSSEEISFGKAIYVISSPWRTLSTSSKPFVATCEQVSSKAVIFGRRRFSLPFFAQSPKVNLKSLRLLVSTRIRTGEVRGNKIHSSTLCTLGIPKMCIGTQDYNVLILYYKCRVPMYIFQIPKLHRNL